MPGNAHPMCIILHNQVGKMKSFGWIVGESHDITNHVTSRAAEEAEPLIGPSRLPDKQPKAKYGTRTSSDVTLHKNFYCRSIVGPSMGAALGIRFGPK